MLKCSKCQKPLEAKDGTKFIALHLKVSMGKGASVAVRKLAEQSLGKYCAYIRRNGNNWEFEISLCYECYLDSLLQGRRTGLMDQMAEEAGREVPSIAAKRILSSKHHKEPKIAEVEVLVEPSDTVSNPLISHT